MVPANTPGVKKSKEIQAILLRRMDHWTDGIIGALVEDTYEAGKSRGARAGAIRERDKDESTAMSYDRKVKAGHIRTVFHQATDRRKGGVLRVNSTDPKMGTLVLEVLRQKDPSLQEVDLSHPKRLAF